MTQEPTIQLIFGIDEPELDDEEKQELTQKLLRQLRALDEVERADRTEDLNPEEGSKPGMATLMGFLTLEVNRKNLGKLLKWLGDRVGDKSMKVRVRVGEHEIELEAKSEQELAKAEAIADRLLEKLGERSGES